MSPVHWTTCVVVLIESMLCVIFVSICLIVDMYGSHHLAKFDSIRKRIVIQEVY